MKRLALLLCTLLSGCEAARGAVVDGTYGTQVCVTWSTRNGSPADCCAAAGGRYEGNFLFGACSFQPSRFDQYLR
jgi:hypothetical protein